MKVVVVCDRPHVAAADRQARAAVEAGAEIHLLVVHRRGALGAAALGLALRRLRRRFPYELVHAHDGARELARRARPGAPVVTVAVHPGIDLPARAAPDVETAALVTVAPLVARARHADVLRALWLLRDVHPDIGWDIVGSGPERGELERLAGALELDGRVRFGAPAEAARPAAVFVLPSVEEESTAAYLGAMAAGVPAIGCRGEPGPEAVAAAGPGLRLVAPADPEALAHELRALLDEPGWRHELGEAARTTVAEAFSWERCGRETVAAYERALS